ncbi:hypothetical protein BESB_015910 [Besnoitia besnoiti]|uniref:C3H1-type domain-containing protein n=1 Tax=Besnoitia besnoiti TaxID=94643 RepID=A0A2A9M9B6_BESBE|nr:hypothetical protein BESB_015910 [Besnoitia besnoiti]PFH32273.1 hypothetical protein BESB_015910 [Besnoitia besnoiti]
MAARGSFACPPSEGQQYATSAAFAPLSPLPPSCVSPTCGAPASLFSLTSGASSSAATIQQSSADGNASGPSTPLSGIVSFLGRHDVSSPWSGVPLPIGRSLPPQSASMQTTGLGTGEGGAAGGTTSPQGSVSSSAYCATPGLPCGGSTTPSFAPFQLPQPLQPLGSALVPTDLGQVYGSAPLNSTTIPGPSSGPQGPGLAQGTFSGCSGGSERGVIGPMNPAGAVISPIPLQASGVPVSRHFDVRRPAPFDLAKFDRRDPHIHFYLPVDCPHSRRCSDGCCPLAHTKLEKIFHPIVYKTQTCQMSLSSRCEYYSKCAFYHTDKDRLEAEFAWRLWEHRWSSWRQQVDQILGLHNKLEKEIKRKVEGILKIRMPRQQPIQRQQLRQLTLEAHAAALGQSIAGRRGSQARQPATVPTSEHHSHSQQRLTQCLQTQQHLLSPVVHHTARSVSASQGVQGLSSIPPSSLQIDQGAQAASVGLQIHASPSAVPQRQSSSDASWLWVAEGACQPDLRRSGIEAQGTYGASPSLRDIGTGPLSGVHTMGKSDTLLYSLDSGDPSASSRNRPGFHDSQGQRIGTSEAESGAGGRSREPAEFCCLGPSTPMHMMSGDQENRIARGFDAFAISSGVSVTRGAARRPSGTDLSGLSQRQGSLGAEAVIDFAASTGRDTLEDMSPIAAKQYAALRSQAVSRSGIDESQFHAGSIDSLFQGSGGVDVPTRSGGRHGEEETLRCPSPGSTVAFPSFAAARHAERDMSLRETLHFGTVQMSPVQGIPGTWTAGGTRAGGTLQCAPRSVQLHSHQSVSRESAAEERTSSSSSSISLISGDAFSMSSPAMSGGGSSRGDRGGTDGVAGVHSKTGKSVKADTARPENVKKSEGKDASEGKQGRLAVDEQRQAQGEARYGQERQQRDAASRQGDADYYESAPAFHTSGSHAVLPGRQPENLTLSAALREDLDVQQHHAPYSAHGAGAALPTAASDYAPYTLLDFCFLDEDNESSPGFRTLGSGADGRSSYFRANVDGQSGAPVGPSGGASLPTESLVSRGEEGGRTATADGEEGRVDRGDAGAGGRISGVGGGRPKREELSQSGFATLLDPEFPPLNSPPPFASRIGTGEEGNYDVEGERTAGRRATSTAVFDLEAPQFYWLPQAAGQRSSEALPEANHAVAPSPVVESERKDTFAYAPQPARGSESSCSKFSLLAPGFCGSGVDAFREEVALRQRLSGSSSRTSAFLAPSHRQQESSVLQGIYKSEDGASTDSPGASRARSLEARGQMLQAGLPCSTEPEQLVDFTERMKSARAAVSGAGFQAAASERYKENFAVIYHSPSIPEMSQPVRLNEQRLATRLPQRETHIDDAAGLPETEEAQKEGFGYICRPVQHQRSIQGDAQLGDGRDEKTEELSEEREREKEDNGGSGRDVLGQPTDTVAKCSRTEAEKDSEPGDLRAVPSFISEFAAQPCGTAAAALDKDHSPDVKLRGAAQGDRSRRSTVASIMDPSSRCSTSSTGFEDFLPRGDNSSAVFGFPSRANSFSAGGIAGLPRFSRSSDCVSPFCLRHASRALDSLSVAISTSSECMDATSPASNSGLGFLTSVPEEGRVGRSEGLCGSEAEFGEEARAKPTGKATRSPRAADVPGRDTEAAVSGAEMPACVRVQPGLPAGVQGSDEQARCETGNVVREEGKQDVQDDIETKRGDLLAGRAEDTVDERHVSSRHRSLEGYVGGQEHSDKCSQCVYYQHLTEQLKGMLSTTMEEVQRLRCRTGSLRRDGEGEKVALSRLERDLFPASGLLLEETSLISCPDADVTKASLVFPTSSLSSVHSSRKTAFFSIVPVQEGEPPVAGAGGGTVDEGGAVIQSADKCGITGQPASNEMSAEGRVYGEHHVGDRAGGVRTRPKAPPGCGRVEEEDMRQAASVSPVTMPPAAHPRVDSVREGERLGGFLGSQEGASDTAEVKTQEHIGASSDTEGKAKDEKPVEQTGGTQAGLGEAPARGRAAIPKESANFKGSAPRGVTGDLLAARGTSATERPAGQDVCAGGPNVCSGLQAIENVSSATSAGASGHASREENSNRVKGRDVLSKETDTARRETQGGDRGQGGMTADTM